VRKWDVCLYIVESGGGGIGHLCSVSRRKSFKEIERIIGTEKTKARYRGQFGVLGKGCASGSMWKTSHVAVSWWMERKCVYNKPMGKGMKREMFQGFAINRYSPLYDFGVACISGNPIFLVIQYTVICFGEGVKDVLSFQHFYLGGRICYSFSNSQ
jgi:hypothetical protein